MRRQTEVPSEDRPRFSDRSQGWTAGMALVLLIASLGYVPGVLADRTPLKPGWNLFSPDQDIQLGRKVSRDAERQLPMLNDARVDNYLNELGHKLDAHVPPGTPNYPFQYKCVNTNEINAFALPGGFIYINRGVIEAADTEAQLAAVMAHETSHVVLRHGTNQASKAYAAQVPFSVLGGILGGGAAGALGQLVGGFAINSILLKYSRTAETQADVMGTQIMYDTGYDPRGMAQFFEKIQAESKQRPIEFFSNHPNPEHRVERVNEEIDKLGGPPKNYKTNSAEFIEIKAHLKSLPPAPKGPAARSAGSSSGRPAAPSNHYQNFHNNFLSLQYPDNWHSYGQGDAATLAPDGGLVDNGQGGSALAYGVIINVFEPHVDRSEQTSLEQATDDLIQQLERNNPHLSVVRQHERMRLSGVEALSTELAGDSPVGGRESDWLVTALRPEGLLYLVCVAPQSEIDVYEPAFQKIIDSVRFSN